MIRQLFLNERFILWLIILNAVVIFVSGFEIHPSLKFNLSLFDNIITLLFVVELWVKLHSYGKTYFKSHWNKFDFTLIILSVPPLWPFLLASKVPALVTCSYLGLCGSSKHSGSLSLSQGSISFTRIFKGP